MICDPMADEALAFGDVVQLGPGNRWAGCLAFVEDVRPWGIVANIVVPHDGERCAVIPIRADRGTFKRVGACRYLVAISEPAPRSDT